MEHKKLASQLFNQTWDLLDKENRTKSEDALMIHKAHASMYHWMQDGTPLHFQRGEWMISHVYSSLGMSESALYHAKRCLDLTLENKIDDFDLTFAYEAIARAYSIQNKDKAKEYIQLAKKSLDQIKKPEDRQYAESQINNIL
jgi:hypothetical protein